VLFELTCLIIDDDPDDQDLLSSTLKRISERIRCLTAVNGLEGLRTLLQGKAKPDMIFLDLNMPLMNGRQFLSELNKHDALKHIPVVILSTSTALINRNEFKDFSVEHILTKPSTLKGWEQIIKSVIPPRRKAQQH
jgi:CheY-like chemotaxis protein